MSLGIKLSNFIFVNIVDVSTNNNTIKSNIIIYIMLLLADYMMPLMLCSAGNFLKTLRNKSFHNTVHDYESTKITCKNFLVKPFVKTF